MRHAHRCAIHHHGVNVAGVCHGLHDPIPDPRTSPAIETVANRCVWALILMKVPGPVRYGRCFPAPQIWREAAGGAGRYGGYLIRAGQWFARLPLFACPERIPGERSARSAVLSIERRSRGRRLPAPHAPAAGRSGRQQSSAITTIGIPSFKRTSPISSRHIIAPAASRSCKASHRTNTSAKSGQQNQAGSKSIQPTTRWD